MKEERSLLKAVAERIGQVIGRKRTEEALRKREEEIRKNEAVVRSLLEATPVGVALLVNRGAAGRSYVMPDLVGTDAERAADILRQRGFRVSIVGTQPYPGVPAGIVLRQQPQGGYQVGSGDPISLEVTR